MDDYDAYHLWLGIPPEEQPPSHYRLLGVHLFEQNAEVIRNAADRQRAHVKRIGINQFEKIGQDLLNEIEMAKICLLRPEKRAAYDEQLRTRIQQQASGSPDAGVEERAGEETLIIGSDKNCDIVIDLATISGVHCSVMRRKDKVILRDLKSTNGTFVNFKRVARPTKITPGDLVILGRDTRLKLPIAFYPNAMQVQRVGFVGRSDQCEVQCDEHTVSAFHARIVFDNSMVFIEDLESTNGTYVIDQAGKKRKLEPLKPVPINDYATVSFGKHRIDVSQMKMEKERLNATWTEDSFSS